MYSNKIKQIKLFNWNLRTFFDSVIFLYKFFIFIYNVFFFCLFFVCPSIFWLMQ